MSSIWQKPSGIWCITYREDGRQRVRSLRTRNKQAARRLQRQIDDIIEQRNPLSFRVSAAPIATSDPTIDDFWQQLKTWAAENRSAKTVQEYENWFFTGYLNA